MKTYLTALLSLVFAVSSPAQNRDLPGPGADLQTLPAGSYVLAMDNTNQKNNANHFNLKSYGLAVHLLNNNVKLKWVIKAGKSKDGIDFTVNASPLLPVITTVTRKITTVNGSTAATVDNATGLVTGMTVTCTTSGLQAGTTVTAISGTNITLSLPATAAIGNKDAVFTSYTYPVSSYDFRAGPFVIFAADTSGMGDLINAYNSSIPVYNDKVKVYKTTAAVTVDIRYDMSGFRPKANILNDGNNTDIHILYMTNCGITTDNYTVGSATDLYTRCFTFASEPHNGTENSAVINAIKSFVQHGGNFLAQCLAVETYENSSSGRFHTTTGITVTNTNIAPVNTVYPNPDLAFTQFEGTYDVDLTGSCKNWTLASGSSWKNNAHNHATGGTIVTQTPVGASVAKLTGAALPGGIVFYLGNHDFTSITDIDEINGTRMYMNAFLTPVAININCNINEQLANPLPVKLVDFQATLNSEETTVSLRWTTASESGLSHFVAERSTDGKNFIPVGEVRAKGLTAELQSYQLSDAISSIASPQYYYRLRQVDRDGKAEYSPVRAVRPGKKSTGGFSISSYPNPVVHQLTVVIEGIGQQKPVRLELLNSNGAVVRRADRNSQGNSLLMDLSQLAPGLYVLRATGEGQVLQQKIIKQ